MVDQTILGRIVLSFQSTEESLLGTQNLHSAGGVFSKVGEGACMTDQPCTNQFTNESSEIGGNGVHSVTEIFRELCAIFGDGDDLIAEVVDVIYVLVRNFATHADLGGNFKCSFEIFG